MKGTDKVCSFVRQAMARIKGDTPKVIAEKNFRTVDAALTAQVAALQGKLVKDENALDAAKEKLAEARYPTELIMDMEAYITNVKTAQEAVDKAQKEIDNTKHSIDYYNKMKEENNAETPAEEKAE